MNEIWIGDGTYMPNIFDGIKRMTDDEIRMQIALLNNVTFINVAKETGNRVLGGLADLANAFSEAFSKKAPFEYQVTKVADFVRQDIIKLQYKERVQLEFELRRILLARCRELETDTITDEVSDERLSILLATEAAKTYGLEKYMTPAHKLEEVSAAYKNAFLQNLHSHLVRQTPDEAKETDLNLQKRLNEVPLETKRELQQKLLPKEFSGKGIGRILRLEKSTKYLGYTVDYLGYNCFDFVNSNVSTILTTVRGLKRIARVLLAEFVWKAVESYGMRLTISPDVLPGYQSPQDRVAHAADEKQFRATLLQRQQAEEQMDTCDTAIEKLNRQILDTRDRFELESREYDEINMKFMGLESKKDEYMNGSSHTPDESKQYYSDVNNAKRKLDSARNEYEKWQNKIHDMQAQAKKLESERNTALLNVEVIRHKTDAQVNLYAQELKKKWIAFYFKFGFEESIFSRVVIDFTADERVAVEQMLKEMHDSRDMKAFAIETRETGLDGEDMDAQTETEKEMEVENTASSEQDQQHEVEDKHEAEDKHEMEDDTSHAEPDGSQNATAESETGTRKNKEAVERKTVYETMVMVAASKKATISYDGHHILEIKKA